MTSTDDVTSTLQNGAGSSQSASVSGGDVTDSSSQLASVTAAGAGDNCTQSFDFGPWTLTVHKSHIMASECQKPGKCCLIEDNADRQLCSFCRYSRQLDLPCLPEMLFGDNGLRIQHTAGHGVLFTPLDALKLVDAHAAPAIVVACAAKWKQSRCDLPGVDSVQRPFDWTYCTDYSGTLIGKHMRMIAQPTELRIDLERLRQRDKIMFYQHVVLYEDELADNGCSLCSVKVRVMAASFFVLMRHYLRVDEVLVRVADTRLFHEAGSDFILRECSVRQSDISQLQVPMSVIVDPDQIWTHLSVVTSQNEILKFPPTP